MLIVVDIESDGPAPALYSMVSFAAVVVEPGLKRHFRGETAPISQNWIPEALAISGVSREQHLAFPPAFETMRRFDQWYIENFGDTRHQMISDNNGFDWSFLNFYLWAFTGGNPMGWSSRRLNDLYAGSQNDASATQGWKKFCKTEHTHDPLDDAMGMAEALLEMKARGMRIEMIPG